MFKRKKKTGRINSRKTVVLGIEFDSKTEAEYYLFLKSNPEVVEIKLQPQYMLLEGFYITTRDGKRKKRRDWKFTADFLVTYKDGTQEVIDVKGYANDRFPYMKKMFEYRYKQELVVVMKDKQKGWIRK
ncbi:MULTISPECIES: DUF1064 domain-containing protein [Bacillus]|uniref:DUF1064 domain-containing protein n=1 Tax=Bacillus TaxID=1386 RepID=UPI0001A19023|nr:DUF1064 domain-containing protein [Bacillus pseudomycoides]EEM14060.1 hypothetical protein bpmyx0001_50560 [Bacillus pseudomycoides DSM 12442]MED1599590.1 DUF1064 domain-containing protein [Bacillus pseudomycoides]OOR49111.1 hypothetical protein BLX05_26020 [Bacillus pseudomycoides]PDY08929.1 DUF1064 domain-containing protein [Bacillus pseudomycoides]PDZ12285.1 DUF1064 domain-containing protein [Bacillus pseudomycoides]